MIGGRKICRPNDTRTCDDAHIPDASIQNYGGTTSARLISIRFACASIVSNVVRSHELN